jgi:hypothetical protein
MAHSPSKPFTSSAEVAAYVATVSNELATLARQNGLDVLAYLLEMARLEAENTAGPPRQAKRS